MRERDESGAVWAKAWSASRPRSERKPEGPERQLRGRAGKKAPHAAAAGGRSWRTRQRVSRGAILKGSAKHPE